MPRNDDDEILVFRGAGAREYMERMFAAEEGGEGDEGDEDEDDGLDDDERSILAGLLSKKSKAKKPAAKMAPAKRGYFKA